MVVSQRVLGEALVFFTALTLYSVWFKEPVVIQMTLSALVIGIAYRIVFRKG